MTPWLVTSPEYGEVVPILDDGTGPMEYGCDYVFIEAETRRDAILLGVAWFQKHGARYLRDADSPYSGVKAVAQTCPAHGLPVWCKDHYECPQCEGLVGFDG